jgi:hypothetical protein
MEDTRKQASRYIAITTIATAAETASPRRRQSNIYLEPCEKVAAHNMATAVRISVAPYNLRPFTDYDRSLRTQR